MQWYWHQKQQRDGISLVEDSGFGGPVWSRSMGTSEEEETEHVIKATPLAVGKIFSQWAQM